MPTGAPAVHADDEIRERFGVRDPIAVVLRSDHPDGVFNAATLRRVRDLTAAFLRLEGVRPADVLSLATAQGFRVKPGTLTFRTFLEPLPEIPAEIQRLRDDLRRIELYDGILISRDGRGAAIFIGTPPGADRVALVDQIRRIAAAAPVPDLDRPIEITGAPVAEALLGSHILADLGVPAAFVGRHGDGKGIGLVPVALAVMALVFLAAFRRAAAAVLPLAEAGGCLIVVFGLMGWLGVPIYLTTAVLPVILTAVGLADEIHIFRRYVDLVRERPGAERPALVRATLDEMAPPVVRTSLTTAVAFLSFALSPIGPVRAFGLFTAFGVLVCLVWSLSVVPAVLVLVPANRLVAPRRRPDRIGRSLGRLAALGSRRPVVLGAALLAGLVALDGIRRLEVQDSWLAGFDPASGFAQASRYFDRQFLGSHQMLLSVEGEPRHLEGEVEAGSLDRHVLRLPSSPAAVTAGGLEGSWIRVFRLGGEEQAPSRPQATRGWSTWIQSARREGDRWVLTLPRRRGSGRIWLRSGENERLGYEIRSEPLMIPAVLERIGALEAFLAGLPGVGGVLGPASYLETVGFMMQPHDRSSRRLPIDPERARLRWRYYERIRGEEHLAMIVDRGFARGLVTVYLEGSNYADSRRLEAEIRDYQRRHLEPHGIRLRLGGDVAVSQALIDAVVATQLSSLLLSLLGILAVAALLGRSLRWGLCCVLPPASAVLSIFAFMGWLGIPLGVATSMFAGMTLGVGVDFSLHLLSRRRHLRRAGKTGIEAMAGALRTVGPAILIDALAIGLGFGVLILSQVPANARLGGLLVLSVLACLASTLLLIPASGPRQSTATTSG